MPTAIARAYYYSTVCIWPFSSDIDTCWRISGTELYTLNLVDDEHDESTHTYIYGQFEVQSGQIANVVPSAERRCQPRPTSVLFTLKQFYLLLLVHRYWLLCLCFMHRFAGGGFFTRNSRVSPRGSWPLEIYKKSMIYKTIRLELASKGNVL